ncbi:uncharacterized protein LOC124936058 [Impatiens glandulifera]|uniref:uncharacterized protein LOC124936058 n=1 Tax=Impatiens glandulifera TaxID=253017 RepID=UPI001FB0F0C3|nr:uncharacterized protein LOC124936058 [Impatiens glandulifera]
MNIWNKMAFPVRKVWLAVSSRFRIRPRQTGGGLVKLSDDIQTCGYEDVQVMWEMLRTTTTIDSHDSNPNRNHRLLAWSQH